MVIVMMIQELARYENNHTIVMVYAELYLFGGES